jgi:hypothetical protein
MGSKRMGKLFIMAAVATAGWALLLTSSAFGSDRWRSSRATEERAIRALISEWVEAYQNLDAKRLAAHETPAVEVVDRFGQLRLLSTTSENENLWSPSRCRLQPGSNADGCGRNPLSGCHHLRNRLRGSRNRASHLSRQAAGQEALSCFPGVRPALPSCRDR